MKIHYKLTDLGVYFLADDIVDWFDQSVDDGEFKEYEVSPFTDAIEELADKIKEEDA
jgi:hypothetical protein